MRYGRDYARDTMASSRGPATLAGAVRYVWRHPANRGRRARALAQAASFQIRGRLLGRPTVVPIGERSRIRLVPGRGQAGLAYANPPEVPEINAWRRALRPGDLFVDVGANVGAYTIWALERGCEVIAIEPDAWAVEQLRANLALNGYAADVRRAAVADVAGSVRVTTGLGVLNRIVLGDEPGVATEAVQAVTLDDVLGARAAAGVKVDVEGAELLVLRGAERALSERRIALLQLEWVGSSEATVGESRAAVADLLARHGYELLTPDEDGTLRPPAHLGPQQPDLFARPRA